MKNFDEFYPTPESLFEIATEGCDFKRIKTILEPSAGKGDIVEYLQKKAEENYMEYDIDCIEIEEELRSILKGKNMRVIYDDFLTFHTTKQYDLICANFPFYNGDEHLWKALELQKNGGAIIAIINGKVSAALSKEYAILPDDELIEHLEKQLMIDHPEYEFDKGMVSHEYLMVEYLLNDTLMEESVRLKLNDAGAHISSLKAGIRFSTSDVGLSKVYASIFYDADGIRTTLGSGIEMEHKGDASPEKFEAKMEDLGLLFRECEERIEELGNIPIRNLAGCVREIREVFTFLPKATAEEVETELQLKYPNGGTAIDVYLALNDIIQRHTKTTNASPTRYLNLSEQVAKLMNLPYGKIECGEWKQNN